MTLSANDQLAILLPARFVGNVCLTIHARSMPSLVGKVLMRQDADSRYFGAGTAGE
ncbi:hypothetical protein [Thiocystis violacea]|uniref:hypothetical protein n=1 Tax=Thiocystis violacea TaxID=13725 RepID=UPI0019050ED1|nr:hypothetical protein [Thiocystis violacea]